MSKLAYLQDILLTEGSSVVSSSILLTYNESTFSEVQIALGEYQDGTPVFVKMSDAVTICASDIRSMSPIGGLSRIGIEGCKAVSGTILNQAFVIYSDDVWDAHESTIDGIEYATVQEARNAVDEVINERS